MEQADMSVTRADVARSVSMLMLNPKFHRDLERKAVADADGDFPVLVAAPDEPAVVALHRAERMKIEYIVLVTAFDGRVHVCHMRGGRMKKDGAEDPVDLVGGVTVRDWIMMMRENPRSSYVATGSDIMAAVSASEYAVA